MKKLGILTAVLVLFCSSAFASQNSITLPNTGTLSGLSAVNDINAANNTMATNFSGSSQPGSPLNQQLFANSSTGLLQIYDGSAWDTIGTFGSGVFTFTGTQIAAGTINSARLPSPFTNGSISGNTSTFATTTGTLTSTHCVKIDSNGNFVDSGSACGGAGGSPGGSSGQMQYNSASSFGGTPLLTVGTSLLTLGTSNFIGVVEIGSTAQTFPASGLLVGTTDTQTVTNKTISGSSNTLSSIANSSLTNSSITLGSTAIPLGSTVSSVTGLNTTGNAATVTTNANLTGDVTSSGNATTLANVNSTSGSYGSATNAATFTVNAKGLVTVSSSTPIAISSSQVSGLGSLAGLSAAPAGTLTGTTLNSTVVSSSLTSVGTIGTGTWQGTAIGSSYLPLAASTTYGIMKPDNSTITCTSGVCSSSGGGGGGTITLGTSASVTNPQRTSDATTGIYSGTTGEVDFSSFGTKAVGISTASVGINAPMVITSASANALAIGTNGTTNPVFQVSANTANAVTGINIIGAQGGNRTVIQELDPQNTTSSGLSIQPAGSGNISLGPQIGSVPGSVIVSATSQVSFNTGGISNSFPNFIYNIDQFGGDSSISGEVPIVDYNWGGQTRGHQTGTTALQRDFYIQGATDTWSSASTLTNSANLGVDYKQCGSNGTCVNQSAIYVATKALTGTVTNSYGLNIAAASGASNNYAAIFTGGSVGIGSTAPTATLDVAGNSNTHAALTTTLTTAISQGAAGFFLPFSTTAALSAGEIVQGTSIPTNTVINTIGAGTSVHSTTASGAGSGYNVTVASATGIVTGMIVTDTTTSAHIANQCTVNFIASTVITLTCSAASIANSDGLNFYPTIKVSQASTSTIGSGASINFTTNAQNASVTALTVAGDISMGGNINVAGSPVIKFTNSTINGDPSITTPSINSVAIGSSALAAQTAEGGNVAIGGYALAALAGQQGYYEESSFANLTNGGFNTAVGLGAGLNANTTGATASSAFTSYNVMVGAFDGQQIQGGNRNTCVGEAGCQLLSSGSFNSYYGSETLNLSGSGPSGSFNSSVGADSAQRITTGAGNAFLGYENGQWLTGSSDNAFIGYQAGQYMIGASSTDYNIGIGAYALQGSTTAANDTGVQNTAIGVGSLDVITSGSSNVAVGFETGQALTTGGNNLILGPKTAQGTLATGSSNILIGVSNAITTSSSSASNEIHIGGTGGDAIEVTGTGTNTTEAVTINGGVSMPNIASASTGDYVCWNSNVLGRGTATCSLSDENAKQDIVPLSDALAEVMAFQPLSFRYKDGFGYDTSIVHVGFTAQRMAKVDPRIVVFLNGKPHAIAYDTITSINSSAIQDLQHEIEHLKAANNPCDHFNTFGKWVMGCH